MSIPPFLSASTPASQTWFDLLRIALSAIVVITACAMMFMLRAYFIGEDGSSMAIYFLGVLVVDVAGLIIFRGNRFNPEKIALTLCIVAFLITALRVNFEEKIVMPLMARSCTDATCVVEYHRLLPFSDVDLVYTQKHGWRVSE